MRMLWMFLIGLMWLPFIGHAKPKQVFFDDAMRKNEGATAFYMDRNGDLYPPASVSLDMLHFLNRRGGVRPYVPTRSLDFASLKSLYRWKATRPEDRDWPDLLAETGMVGTDNFEADWVSLQRILRTRVARDISALRNTHDDVVLMIHGYNNDHKEAQCWYAKAEENLRAAGVSYGRRVTFVRMYWDGLAGTTPLFIWGRAQYNGYVVGLELRRLLREVDGDTPLRVFTHSSGAYVITNAMGDASAGAQLGAMPPEYHCRSAGLIAGYEPPMQLRDLRVAMLVPAQPTIAFQNYFRSPGSDRRDPEKRALVPGRLILGLSKRDIATNKAGVVPCSVKGATCMAVKIRQSCSQVASDLDITPPRLMAVNFAKQGLYHGHGVEKYMKAAEWPELTRALLAPDPGIPTATDKLCRSINGSDATP